MITLGLILLIVGAIFGIPLAYTLGGILLVVGVALFILGQAGRAVGGRNHWF